MNYNSDASNFVDVITKLPEEFLKDNPKLVIGGLVSLIILPHLVSGIEYIADTCKYCYCFKEAAENGLLVAPSIEKPNVLLLDESAA